MQSLLLNQWILQSDLVAFSFQVKIHGFRGLWVTAVPIETGVEAGMSRHDDASWLSYVLGSMLQPSHTYYKEIFSEFAYPYITWGKQKQASSNIFPWIQRPTETKKKTPEVSYTLRCPQTWQGPMGFSWIFHDKPSIHHFKIWCFPES